jgi:ABC-type polysaccharide/polyol phosphate transport system ATPase subunit
MSRNSVSNSSTALEVDGLFKKFRRGETYHSLRDLVPAITGGLIRGQLKQKLAREEFWALREVSFSVERGEAFGIIGRNGAGKSTLLKLLTRIMRPTLGSIRVSGRISALIEVSAGFHGDLTGRENIYLNGSILGMTKEEINRQFDSIVDFSGLGDFIDTPVKRYSSGMYARLGFSVAAHVDPDVLLVDEVLSVGDYLFQRKCIERMNEVIGSGATVIFVSHNLRAVTNLCKRSMLLDVGEVKMIDRTEDVVKAYYKSGQERHRVGTNPDISISSVTVHDRNGATVEFESGGKFFITVEAYARTAHPDLSVVIAIIDDHQYLVFDTCSARLGAGNITLGENQTLRCTFELDLNLAAGTFHVNAFLYRYLTQNNYDRWLSATTFFVTGTPDVRGVVTLHPRLVAFEVGSSNGMSEAHPAMEAEVVCD